MTETYALYPEITPPPIDSEYDTAVEHVTQIVFYGVFPENLIKNEFPEFPAGLKEYLDKWLATTDEDNVYYHLVVENFSTALKGYIQHFNFFNNEESCFVSLMHDVLQKLSFLMLRNHYTYYQREKTIHNLRNSMMASIRPNWKVTEFEM